MLPVRVEHMRVGLAADRKHHCWFWNHDLLWPSQTCQPFKIMGGLAPRLPRAGFKLLCLFPGLLHSVLWVLCFKQTHLISDSKLSLSGISLPAQEVFEGLSRAKLLAEFAGHGKEVTRVYSYILNKKDKLTLVVLKLGEAEAGGV